MKRLFASALPVVIALAAAAVENADTAPAGGEVQ